ncbi:MAG: isoleucine--tRNA ligase [Patescibacteria group bacterium]
MKKITKISNYIKFPELEQNITQFWQENRVFEQSLKNREGQDRYAFMDGPPFVSGSPHFGSLIPSVAKDIIPRYQTMKGKYVRRVFGWDCHGLPIEQKISEKFNLKNRDQIEEFGLKKYIEECRAHVRKCTTDWQYYIDAIGRWVDTENAYYTMNPEFNESVLWVYKQAYDKGLVYKGNRVSLYSVDNQTPVSEFEVNMDPSNYRNVEDIAIYVTFPIEGNIEGIPESKGASAIIWTTTPWTIPAHLCMAYNSDLTYVVAQNNGLKYILAESRLKDVFGLEESAFGEDSDSEVQILARFNGSKLEGVKYQPVYSHQNSTPKHFTMYEAEYVTDSDGTGLVHIAKYGKEDVDLCNKHGIEYFDSITLDGVMLENGPAAGLHMRKALDEITKDIDQKNKLFKSEKYTHRLPFYRGESPLIYMPQISYFIDVQKLKPRMLELNKEINWYPDHLKNGRFLDVIENAPDWCISRTRFWATIMPLWINDDGDEIVCGSIEEMMRYTDQIEKVDNEYHFKGEKLYLHRDFCDQIILTKDGKEYKRVPEVLDCWLDSGSVPFAEFSYPFMNQKEFKDSYPADYIIEYTGQLRAWFNMLLRVSVIAFDDLPFKNSVVTGNMQGNDGRKMSKSFGNYPDPKDVLENIGAEALRLQLMGSSVMLGEDSSWSDDLLNEQVKNVLIPFWNTFTYFTIYSELHNYTPKNAEFDLINVLDKWLYNRVYSAINEYEESLKTYNFPNSVKAIRPVIDDISTWYIRRSRDRFASGDESAIQNLYASLVLLMKAFAPQLPFLTERMYQEIVVGILPEAKLSVHLEDYPKQQQFETTLLEDMQKLRELCSLGLAIRSEQNLAVRQPLAKVVTDLSNSELREVLKEELNCKEVEFVEDFEGYVVKESSYGKVGIDTNLSEELIEEGQLADLCRKIQNSRKNSGLQMGEAAKCIYYTSESKIEDFITKNSPKISSTTALSSLEKGTDSKGEKLKFMGSELYISFDK